MAIIRASFRSWLLLLTGLVILTGLACWQAWDARRSVLEYASSHAQAGKRGMGVWLYDNPFQTGEAQFFTKPPPNLHKDRLPPPEPGQPPAKQRPYPFAWRWIAFINAPAQGQYLLGVFAPEGIRLYVDGREVIERWEAKPPRDELALLKLEPGPHLIDLANVQRERRLELTLFWAPPGARDRELIPADLATPLAATASPPQLDIRYQALLRWRVLLWLLPLAWLGLWLLALGNPQRARRFLKEHRWFLAILGLAALLRLAWGATVHGISGESAFFAWRAELILQGAWPFQGMNTRVGPFWDYVLTLPTALFGPTAWGLRATAAAMYLLAMAFAYRVLLREAGKPTALAAALMLAALPALVMFSRMPVEFMALGPLLFFAGLDLFSLARRKPPLAVLGGVLWGLGMFNHSVFIVFPATLGLAALAVSRLNILKSPIPWGAALGYGLVMLPRLWDRLSHPEVQDDLSFLDPDRMRELGGFVMSYLKALDGELVYQLFTGQLLIFTWWVIPALLAAAALLLVWGLIFRRDDGSWLEATLIIALLAYLLMAPLGAPTANPRYFAYALILTALILGRAWARSWQWSPPCIRRAVLTGLLAFSCFCLASLGVNYFYAHLSTGGLPLEWDDPLLDHTSDAWMNHDLLARELEKRGYPVVATADYWHHTLHLALNLYQGRPLKFQAVSWASRSHTERAAVFYNSPEGRRIMREFIDGHKPKEFRHAPLPASLADKYILLERVGPEVEHPSDLDGVW